MSTLKKYTKWSYKSHTPESAEDNLIKEMQDHGQEQLLRGKYGATILSDINCYFKKPFSLHILREVRKWLVTSTIWPLVILQYM